MAIPKVFISYSHDSQEHKKWVLDLATRLRNTGVDAIIDQWELKPGDDLAVFMENHLVMPIESSWFAPTDTSKKPTLGPEESGTKK